MEKKVRVHFDSFGNTLNVWFDDPKKEHLAEEMGEEVILVKDRKGRVIGFEKLNFLSEMSSRDVKSIPIELLVV